MLSCCLRWCFIVLLTGACDCYVPPCLYFSIVVLTLSTLHKPLINVYTVLGIIDSPYAHLGLNFREIAMQLGLHEDDAVEKFLDHLVLVLLVRVGYGFQADFGLFVHSRLGAGCRASM